MVNPFRKHSLLDSEKEVARIYNLYREHFINYFNKHSVDRSILEDIYQDSFMVLYEDVHKGKISEDDIISLKDRLFSIGYNKLMKHFLKQKNLTFMGDVPELEEIDNSEEWIEMQKIVREVVGKMEELCKKVLSLYYWERKKMIEIAKEIEYKSEQAAKNKKYICMRKLGEVVIDRFRREGLI